MSLLSMFVYNQLNPRQLHVICRGIVPADCACCVMYLLITCYNCLLLNLPKICKKRVAKNNCLLGLEL